MLVVRQFTRMSIRDIYVGLLRGDTSGKPQRCSEKAPTWTDRGTRDRTILACKFNYNRSTRCFPCVVFPVRDLWNLVRVCHVTEFVVIEASLKNEEVVQRTV
ncbi:unnamed protein product [Sphacelaria rigidula]